MQEIAVYLHLYVYYNTLLSFLLRRTLKIYPIIAYYTFILSVFLHIRNCTWKNQLNYNRKKCFVYF